MTEKSNQSLTKRGFNLPHVFSWQIVVLLVVYVLVLFYQFINTDGEGYFSYSIDYPRGFNNLSKITFFAGFLVSFLQFKFLQIKTKCITILSFGETRRSLFRKKFWIPLLCLVLLTVCYYFVQLCVLKKLQKNFSVLADEYFANILIALLPLIVGYTAGAFARIVSGKTSEAVIFGGAICCLPNSVFSFIDSVFALSLKGYYVMPSDFGYSNYVNTYDHVITNVLSIFDPLYTLNPSISGFGNNDFSASAWFETPLFYILKNLVWIVLIIFIIFLIEKHFVENFKVENCNKSGKNNFVRVVISVGLATMISSTISWIIYEHFGAEVQSFVMLPLLIAVLVVALAVTVIVTLLIYRHKNAICFSLVGSAITVAFSLVVYLVSATGCFGYSTYMPETSEIKSVMINDPVGILCTYSPEYVSTANEGVYANMCFKNQDEIEKVKAIHNFIALDKNYDTTENFSIVYELKNGDFVCRNYSYLSEDACEKIASLFETDTVHGFYKTIFNQDSVINSSSSSHDWIYWDSVFSINKNDEISSYIYGSDTNYIAIENYWNEDTSYKSVADADSLVIYSKDNKHTYITEEQISREIMEELKKALYEDYTSLSWRQIFKPEKQIGVISLASCEALKESETNWFKDGDYVSSSEQVLKENVGWLYQFSITSDMEKTIEVLKKAGLYKYFYEELEVSEAHLIDSSEFISWVYSYSNIEGNKAKDRNGEYLSSLAYAWNAGGFSDVYLDRGCDYIDLSLENYNDLLFEDWYEQGANYKPVLESDIEKITPEEAEKLREKAFMTYNAGNDCKFLVMKYTDGTANMLVLPN